MARFELRQATKSGIRVVDTATGETATIAGRLLDNMTEAGAADMLTTLERLEHARQDRIDSARKRNDLVAILENELPPDDDATPQ
jgi:hypothetical protein